MIAVLRSSCFKHCVIADCNISCTYVTCLVDGQDCVLEDSEVTTEKHCTDTMMMYLESKAIVLRQAQGKARPPLYINWNQGSNPTDSLITPH